MASFSAGTTFTDGVANDVTAAKLAALVNAATPTSGLIQDRTAESTIAADDTLLFADTSDSSNLKRMTVANFTGTLPTATITTLNSTTGTITTLNSTTGTIPTLVATTLITTGTGTAAAPAIVPTGDANTGLFFPAADTIAFSEGGVEAMRIDPNGNIGIGTNTADIFANSFERNFGILTPSTTAALNISGGVASRIQLGVGSTRHGVIYQDATNYMQVGTTSALPISFTTNSTERLRIDSSGNVGIGTTTPSSKLHVVANQNNCEYTSSGTTQHQLSTVLNGNNANLYYGVEGSSTGRTDVTGTLDNASYFGSRSAHATQLITNNSAKMTIDSSGNVGIGVTSPASTLVVNGAEGVNTGLQILNTSISATSTNGAILRLSAAASPNNANFQIVQQENRAMEFWTNNTERMRIDSSGNVLVGTDDASATQGVGIKNGVSAVNPSISIVANTSANDSNLRYYNTNATYNGYRFYITTNGGVINYSANNVNLSDERLKTNINPAGNYLEKICLIPVKTFIYKDQGDDTERTIGVIAQEVEAHIPELINNDGFGETPADGIPLKTIYQTDLQYVLMRCIQELSAKVTALEAA